MTRRAPFRTYTAPATGTTDSFTYKATSAGGESATYTQSYMLDLSHNDNPSCIANSGFPHRRPRRPLDAGGDRHLVLGRRQRRADLHPHGAGAAARHGDRGQRRHHLHAGGGLHRPGLVRLHRQRRARRHDHEHVLGQRRHPARADLRRARPRSACAPAPRASAVLRLLRRLRRRPDVRDHRPARPRDATPSGTGTSQFRTYKAGATEGDDSFSYRATSDNGTSNTVIQVVHVDADANSAPSCFTNSGFPELVPAGHARTLAPGAAPMPMATRSVTRSCPSRPTARSATRAARSSTRRPTATPARTSSTTRPPMGTAGSPRPPRTTSRS